MIDIVRQAEAIEREVGEGRLPSGPARAIRLRRDYDAPIDDVWDALTNPERIGRWFLPISGDYRLGGRYQFEGNAGGEIVACERPNRLKVTWVYGPDGDADPSEVELHLSAVDAATTRFGTSSRSNASLNSVPKLRTPSAVVSSTRCACASAAKVSPNGAVSRSRKR